MEDKKVFTCHLEAEIGQYPEYCIQDICCGVYKQPNRFVSAILWLLMSLLIIALTCCLIYLWCTYVESKDPPSGSGKIKPEKQEQVKKEKEPPNKKPEKGDEDEDEEENENEEDEEENEGDEAENEEAEEGDEDEDEDTDAKESAKSTDNNREKQNNLTEPRQLKNNVKQKTPNQPLNIADDSSSNYSNDIPSQNEEEASSIGTANSNLTQKSNAKESAKSPDNNREKQNNFTEAQQLKNNAGNATKQKTPNRPLNEADDYSSNDSKDIHSQIEEEASSIGTANSNLTQKSNAKEPAKSPDNNREKQNSFTEAHQLKNNAGNATKQKTPNQTPNNSKDVPSQNEEEASSKGTTNSNSPQNSKNGNVKITYIRERYSYPDVTDQQGSQTDKRDSEEYFNYSYKKLDMKMETL